MSYIQIETKRLMIWVGAIILIFLIIITMKATADNHPSFYVNCNDARAHHDTNIPRSSAYYRPELDKDHDGYACE